MTVDIGWWHNIPKVVGICLLYSINVTTLEMNIAIFYNVNIKMLRMWGINIYKKYNHILYGIYHVWEGYLYVIINVQCIIWYCNLFYVNMCFVSLTHHKYVLYVVMCSSCYTCNCDMCQRVQEKFIDTSRYII